MISSWSPLMSLFDICNQKQEETNHNFITHRSPFRVGKNSCVSTPVSDSSPYSLNWGTLFGLSGYGW